MRVLLCLLLAIPSGGFAQDDVARAKAAYAQGVELFKAKKYREAIAEFNAAHRLDPSPILLYNIARSFEQLREFGSAVEFYHLYLKSPDIDDRAEVEQTVRTLELLQKEQATPESQTRYVLQSEPAGAEVLMDGKPVGVTPITLTVKRGSYAIEVRKDGFEGRRFERALATLEQAETVVLAEISGGSSPRSTWGWVAVGVGGAAIAGAIFTGLQAQSYADKLDDIDQNPGAFSDQDFDDAQSSGQAWGITTDVLWGVGAAGIGTGLWLLLTDDSTPTAGWTPFNAGVAYQGTF